MKTFFKQIMDYELWAIHRSLGAVAKHGENGGSVSVPLRRMGHILGAQRVWLARLGDDPWDPDWIWPSHDVDTCRRVADNLGTAWSGYFARTDETSLERPVRYRTSSGDQHQSSVSEILIHLVAHGAHHRGQIAVDLRALGAEPAVSDFIEYVRG